MEAERSVKKPTLSARPCQVTAVYPGLACRDKYRGTRGSVLFPHTKNSFVMFVDFHANIFHIFPHMGWAADLVSDPEVDV